jgi:ribonucleotide reductase beta subunit family protein with ferritin-like domain
MKKRFILVTIALILVAGLVVAGEKNKPDRISAGENTTESAVPELSKIVVLCATDEKEKFEKEWGKYVAQNDLKGAELQETITWVSDEAAMQRKQNKRMRGDESNDQAWKAERQKLMSEIARRALNPLR